MDKVKMDTYLHLTKQTPCPALDMLVLSLRHTMTLDERQRIDWLIHNRYRLAHLQSLPPCVRPDNFYSQGSSCE